MIGRQNSIPVQDQPASSFRESRARTLIVKVGLLLFFVVVALRLVQIQVIDAAKYREKAERQYESRVDLPALRGKIVDRNQRQLVTNMMFVSFAADPKIIGDRASELAERFAQVFDKPKSQYLEKINLETRRFVYLERRVSPQYEKRINAASFEGLVVKDEPRRLYPYDHVAGQLLGFTDVDNKGLSGIELQLDTLLRGRNGYVIMQRDAIGRRRPSVDYPRIEPINGNTAELTIDIEYQAIAEEELRKGVERNKAESGLAIMLDPATGEVLAMANYPSINPGDPASAGPAAARNRVVTDMFEPGSTFKLVTAAAALERHLVQPDQKFNAEQGEYVVRLPNGKVRNKITDTHKYNVLTFREAIEFSSNIVMAKVSDIVGAEALYTTARNFGFGTECGIELPGEIRGELKKPTQWSGTTLNAMAYGYEVGVTPLQIATAYAAVANGGVLMKPFIVRQIVSPEGEVLHVTRPEVVRRVVSQATAHTLTQFLRGVVERGTGTLAAMKGIPLAGKLHRVFRRVLPGRQPCGGLPGDAGQSKRPQLRRRTRERADIQGHCGKGVCRLAAICPHAGGCRKCSRRAGRRHREARCGEGIARGTGFRGHDGGERHRGDASIPGRGNEGKARNNRDALDRFRSCGGQGLY